MYNYNEEDYWEMERDYLFDIGFRTNIDEKEKEIYEKAIKEYSDETLKIGKGMYGCKYGLWHDKQGDLLKFWEIFERIKKCQ